MQALLLAGGLGTRLKSVVNDRPKPMAQVGEYPFLYYLIEQLKKNEITDIVFAVGYKGSMIEEYFGNGERFGIRASYSYEEGQLGTAGAIKNAERFLKEDTFFVLNADTFYRLSYTNLLEQGEKDHADLVLVLRNVPDCSRYGRVFLEGSRVKTFNEKVGESSAGLINGGIYLMKRRLLAQIPEGKCSLENEMIPLWLSQGRIVSAYVSDDYFIDIGIPEDYFQFQKDIENLNSCRNGGSI